MQLLAIDAGSSSVKAQLFKSGRPVGRAVRVVYPSSFDGLRAEVTPTHMLAAVMAAIQSVPDAKKADCVGLSVMSPAWVAMDRRGKAITPIVTHQDRRSMKQALAIEQRVGKERHLKLAGNRPFPGSITSTTYAWFKEHASAVMKRADLVGLLNTFLHRQITGTRVIDPSNASFTGVYLTCRLGGWSDELCRATGISQSLLPEILESNEIAGTVTPAAAAEFGLRAGTPVMTGMVDTSAAMMLTGAPIGQMVNTRGSTDVLAVVCGRPKPHDLLLLRALGVGRKWLSVSTIAAGGASLDWMRRQFFREMSESAFHKLADEISSRRPSTSVRFDPYLAGERSSMEQKQAAFSGLTLGSTREEMLASVIAALSEAAIRRLKLLASVQPALRRRVLVSGGGGPQSSGNWPGRWSFDYVEEASLRGLAASCHR